MEARGGGKSSHCRRYPPMGRARGKIGKSWGPEMRTGKRITAGYEKGPRATNGANEGVGVDAGDLCCQNNCALFVDPSPRK